VAASGTVAAGLMATGLLTHVTIVFVPAVLVSALLWGLWPAALAIGLSFAANGLLEFAPNFDLQWRHLERPAELMVFTVVVLPFCYVVVRARAQVVEARRRSAAARSLHNFSQRLAGIREEYHLRRAIAEELSTLLEQRVILFSLGVGTLLPIASDDREIPAAVAEAARQRLEAPEGAVQHHGPHHGPHPDGWTIFTLDAAHAGPTAVAIGPPAPGTGNARSRAHRGELLRAMLDQAAVAIDRLQQWSEVEDARVDERAARLRDALINSISHDLRTPLAAVLGSATALQSADGVLGRAARADLLATIREETERLNDYVGNVMDLSRLRGGAIQPRLELTELADIVDTALRRARLIAGRDVVVKLPPDLPMLRLDLFLLQQALVNLIENG
jgi:two-component system sensor histidine kinase KdpD